MREVSIRCVLSQQLHNLFPDQPISRAASLNIVQTRYGHPKPNLTQPNPDQPIRHFPMGRLYEETNNLCHRNK